MLLNLGYCSGLNGSLSDYVLHGARYLHTPRRIAVSVADAVRKLTETEIPDICCFLELHKKSALVKDMRDYHCSDIEDKYGLRSLLRCLPFFRDNCNGFFARADVPFKKLFFTKGSKKLIYELEIENGGTLLMCHFSLSASVRQAQFRELETIIQLKNKVILCGDFNIFKGTDELAELMSLCRLRSAVHSATFPAVRPKKTIDLFLCTEDINVTRCETVRDFRGSDHLPVILEFQV